MRRLWGLLLLLESAAVLPACRLVSFDNLITTSRNRCALPLPMVRLGRVSSPEEDVYCRQIS